MYSLSMKYDVVVIGAGAGGLVVAIGCAKAGKKTLMIEQGNYGGDCTNFGCVPSKSLIASADAAHHIDKASDVGIELNDVKEQSDQALERVRKIVSFIRSHENAEALQKHGIDTLTAKASFKDPHTLLVKDATGKVQEVQGKKIIIAAGSHPFVPPIDGLKDTPYLTNETIFDLKSVPNRLIILGGGPIGCELAQAFQRIGSQVTLIHKHSELLQREPEEASKILMEAMKSDGIEFEMNAETKKVHFSDQEFSLQVEQEGKVKEIRGDQLLTSVGRRPNLKDLELDAAEIKCTDQGICIDNYARTSTSNIFAIGDITGPPFFTHRAEYHGRTVLTSLLLPGPFMKRLDKKQPIPRVTYTDPEIASIGLLEKDAIEQFGDYGVATYKIPFSEVDRAICQGRTEGMIIIVTRKWSSQILGATIIGPRAGEMLLEISVAIHAKFPLKKLAQIIHPYPTYNQGIRKAADLWLTRTILPSILKFFGKNGKRKEK